MHPITDAAPGIYAELIVQNGIVNAETIGCQAADDDPGLDTADVRTDYGAWYSAFIASTGFYDEVSNVERIQAAMDHPDVRVLRMGNSKRYVLAYEVQIHLPDKVLDGNGSMLFVYIFPILLADTQIR